MTNTPKKTGFYWARWINPAPGTDDNGECCMGDSAAWEPVEVVTNCLDHTSPDYLRGAVIGVSKSQSLDCFDWGDAINVPAAYR